MGSAETGPTYLSVKLKSRQEVAEGTMALRFERPSGWTFKADQSIDVTARSRRRIPRATRAHFDRGRSLGGHSDGCDSDAGYAFKRVLEAMTPHNNWTRVAVFLAGGIGSTPFRSIVFRAAREKLPRHIFLFFSNQRPEDAPFLEELRVLEGENSNYKLAATMTQIEESYCPWHGETCLINKEMLSKSLRDTESPVLHCWLTGDGEGLARDA